MHIRFPRQATLWLLSMLLTSLLCGCNTGLGLSRSNNPDAGAIAGPSTPISGQLLLPKTMSVGAILVVAVQADGSVYDTSTTTANGWFQLRGGFDGRVEARLANGTVLAAEVRRTSPSHVCINFATTMVSRCAQSSPDLALSAIETRVRNSLAVPARISLSYDLSDSWRSWFSGAAFVTAAGATPINTFIDSAVARANAGGVQAFRIAHPYPMLFRSLHPKEADAYGIGAAAPAARARAGARAAANAATTSVFDSVAGNVAADVISDGIVSGLGWACQSLGIGGQNSASAQYALILSELQTLQAQVGTINAVGQLNTEISAASVYANNLQTKFSEFNGYLNQNTYAGAVSAAVLLNSYVNPSNGAQVVTDINGVSGFLLGTAGGECPIGPLYASVVADSSFGEKAPTSSVSSGTMFMDVRTNAALDEVATLVDYYTGVVQLGAIMQAEYAHLDPNTFNTVFTSSINANLFASNVQAGQTCVNQVAATLTDASQLTAPATIGSDDVTAFLDVPVACGTSTDPAPLVMNTKIQGPCEYYTATSNAEKFAAGPWGAGTWSLAEESFLENLRTYANNLASLDGSSNGVNYGLWKMGIIANNQTDDIIVYTLGAGVYNLTKGKALDAAPKECNYLLVHYLPDGPGEDPGTMLSTLEPSTVSVTQSAITNTFFEALTCMGVYDGNLCLSPEPSPANLDITPTMTWSSSDNNLITVANYGAVSGQNWTGNGVITLHQSSASPVTVTATLCTYLTGQPGVPPVTRHFTSASVSVTPNAPAPVLTSILVSPYNQNYANAGGGGTLAVNCYATGFYSDNTVKDLTAQVTWSLTHTSVTGTPVFDATVLNQLNLFAAEGSDTITITATYNGADPSTAAPGQATVTTSFP